MKMYKEMYKSWLSPRVPTELWARSVSNIAENISAATRINNDILFGNIDALGRAFERAITTYRRAYKN